MSATVIITGNKATCRNYRWVSRNKDLQGKLNDLLDPLGPSGADPNPDLHAAQKAIKILGGKIIEYDETEWEEGVIY